MLAELHRVDHHEPITSRKGDLQLELRRFVSGDDQERPGGPANSKAVPAVRVTSAL